MRSTMLSTSPSAARRLPAAQQGWRLKDLHSQCDRALDTFSRARQVLAHRRRCDGLPPPRTSVSAVECPADTGLLRARSTPSLFDTPRGEEDYTGSMRDIATFVEDEMDRMKVGSSSRELRELIRVLGEWQRRADATEKRRPRSVRRSSSRERAATDSFLPEKGYDIERVYREDWACGRAFSNLLGQFQAAAAEADPERKGRSVSEPRTEHFIGEYSFRAQASGLHQIEAIYKEDWSGDESIDTLIKRLERALYENEALSQRALRLRSEEECRSQRTGGEAPPVTGWRAQPTLGSPGSPGDRSRRRLAGSPRARRCVPTTIATRVRPVG